MKRTKKKLLELKLKKYDESIDKRKDRALQG